MTQRSYTKNYTIDTPHLKSSENKRPKYNPRLGDFTYQYSRRALEAFGFHAVSFCFFILWNKNKTDGDFNRTIWIKREITIHDNGVVNLADPFFDGTFFANENEEQLYRDLDFFRGHYMQCRYMVVKNLQENFRLSGQTQVAVEVAVGEGKCLRKRPVSLADMESMLIENSNGKFKMKKPLIFYETDLERYLSLHSAETGAVFPGDCDMLLYDADGRCRYILEFKKCTPNGPIPVEKQSFLNYIAADRSKYVRLNLLRKYMEETEGRKIPLVNVFYPIATEQVIKLEEISRDMNSGVVRILQMKNDPEENQYRLFQTIHETDFLERD